jgi:hypothetical protein
VAQLGVLPIPAHRRGCLLLLGLSVKGGMV